MHSRSLEHQFFETRDITQQRFADQTTESYLVMGFHHRLPPIPVLGSHRINGPLCQHDEPKTSDSAGELARILNVPLDERTTLGEVAFGSSTFYDQRGFDRIIRNYLEHDAQGPFVESFDDATTRITDSIRTIARDPAPGAPIAFSHWRILSILWAHLLGRRLTVDE